MVRMGNFSTELCGGTHVDNTGKIGLFKIISESSVAAGVRRIEAVTGMGVLSLIRKKDSLLAETAKELKVQNESALPERAAQLQSEASALRKEVEALNAKLASSRLGDILKNGVRVGSVTLVTAVLGGTDQGALRTLTDEIKADHPDTVAVLASVVDGKVSFAACAGKDAVTAGAHAGKLVGAVAAVTGGKGGGRPDSAMAGGHDASLIARALESAKETLGKMLK